MPRKQQPAAVPLPSVEPTAVQQLYRDFEEADRDGASSNDIAQLLDDWLTEHGFPSVLYPGHSGVPGPAV